MESVSAESPPRHPLKVAAAAGKRLTFGLGEEEVGIEILKVQEIIGLMPVTHVPRAPEFIRGVVNLRGKVIPVMDLRIRFEMDEAEDTEKTCIIVVTIQHQTERPTIVGLLVDHVSEVVDMAADAIEAAPPFGNDDATDFISGIAKLDERVVILLEIDKVVAWRELEGLTNNEAPAETAMAV